ncbi:MAG TPA: toprim domain-containing protein, partial [Fimbriimonadaceae bacterium]|nr:toprim domain-containing protein [Fimbriimonadaceae bacterium]
ERGDLVAFGGRVLGDGLPKYINSSDTPLYRKSRVLYGMFRARDALMKSRRAVLVEGYLDVIACFRAGVRTAMASLGTSMSDQHAKLLKRWCDEVVVLYDADAAGQKAAERASEMLMGEGLRVRVALMPPGEDPDTLLRTAGPGAVERAVEAGIHPLDHRIRSIQQKLQPEDPQYWSAMVEALASAPTHMEMDRWIVKLAPLYPDMPDQVRAQRALRADVGRYRQNLKRPRAADEEKPAAPALQRSELRPREAALLRSFLEPELRRKAWEALREEDLLVTRLAREIAQEVRSAFPDAPPAGEPAAWLDKLGSEGAVTELTTLELASIHRLDERTLDDTLRNLRAERARRETEQMRTETLDDDKLRLLDQKLKQRHGQ